MWFKIHNQQIILALRAKPNAKKTAITAKHADHLVVTIKAIPHQGKANLALIQYLSALFKLPKTSLHLIAGKRGHYKYVALPYSDHICSILEHVDQFVDKKIGL